MATSILTPQATSLEQVAAMESLLLADLEHLIHEPVQSGSRDEVLALLNSLFDLLPSHFDKVEAGGYLKEVTRQFPTWRSKVEVLRIAHAFLYEDLRDLRDAVADEAHFAALPEQTLIEVGAWMDRFRRHEEEERALLQAALNTTIGGGD